MIRAPMKDTSSPTRRSHPSGWAIVVCAGTLMVGAGFAGVGGAAAERVGGAAGAAKVDKHALPLGDGKVSKRS